MSIDFLQRTDFLLTGGIFTSFIGQGHTGYKKKSGSSLLGCLKNGIGFQQMYKEIDKSIFIVWALMDIDGQNAKKQIQDHSHL